MTRVKGGVHKSEYCYIRKCFPLEATFLLSKWAEGALFLLGMDRAKCIWQRAGFDLLTVARLLVSPASSAAVAPGAEKSVAEWRGRGPAQSLSVSARGSTCVASASQLSCSVGAGAGCGSGCGHWSPRGRSPGRRSGCTSSRRCGAEDGPYRLCAGHAHRRRRRPRDRGPLLSTNISAYFCRTTLTCRDKTTTSSIAIPELFCDRSNSHSSVVNKNKPRVRVLIDVWPFISS